MTIVLWQNSVDFGMNNQSISTTTTWLIEQQCITSDMTMVLISYIGVFNMHSWNNAENYYHQTIHSRDRRSMQMPFCQYTGSNHEYKTISRPNLYHGKVAILHETCRIQNETHQILKKCSTSRQVNSLRSMGRSSMIQVMVCSVVDAKPSLNQGCPDYQLVSQEHISVKF